MIAIPHLDRKKSPQPEFLHLTILIELAINRDVLNFRPPRCSVVGAQYLIKLVWHQETRSKSRIIQIIQRGCNWTQTGEARTGQKAKPESVRSRSRSRAHKIRKQIITQTGFVQKLLTIFMKTRNENNLENSWTKTQEAGWNPNWF